jgi:hypothetical protein
VLLEARRWHVADYEAVLPDLKPQDLQVSAGGCAAGLPGLGPADLEVGW